MLFNIIRELNTRIFAVKGVISLLQALFDELEANSVVHIAQDVLGTLPVNMSHQFSINFRFSSTIVDAAASSSLGTLLRVSQFILKLRTHAAFNQQNPFESGNSVCVNLK